MNALTVWGATPPRRAILITPLLVHIVAVYSWPDWSAFEGAAVNVWRGVATRGGAGGGGGGGSGGGGVADPVRAPGGPPRVSGEGGTEPRRKPGAPPGVWRQTNA